MSDESFDFRIVTNLVPRTGEQNLDPAGGTVYPTGLTPLNTSGTREFLQLARDTGCNEKNFLVQYGVLDGTGMVCAYTVDVGTPDAVAFRRYADGNIALHFGGVFSDSPGIRVATRVQCPVFRGKDKKGRDCLILDLRTALEKPKGKSRQNRNQQGQGQSQPAIAQAPAAQPTAAPSASAGPKAI